MSVLFYIDNPLEDLIKRYILNSRQLELASTQKDRRYYNGRASAFREAIETVDLYVRSQTEDCAVELRSAKDIMNEVASE